MPKTIRNWEDMKDYGVYHLTGEADPLGRRALVDLSSNGEKLVKCLLGIPDESKLYKNHNSGRGEPDGLAVASISLPYDILADLAVVALVQAGARKVIIAPDGITGIMDDHDEKNVQAYISYHGRDKLTIIPVKRAG
jgi:hypothetical protein